MFFTRVRRDRVVGDRQEREAIRVIEVALAAGERV
jgi:hypothetical protein